MSVAIVEDLIVKVESYAIELLSESSETNPFNTSKLVEEIVKKLRKDDIAGYKIYRILIELSQDPASRISSRKGKNGGYYLLGDGAVSGEDAAPTKGEIENQKAAEKHLWPAAADWLRLVKDVSQTSYTVADKRGGGVWSNPDVVGLSVIDALGFFDVEITTLEVKQSLKSWRYFFFEAVSHKRFSERAYFVYRSKEMSDAAERLELIRYAEKYGVGIVEIQISNEDFNLMMKWKSASDAKKSEILNAFVEIVPAPFEAISVRDKVRFLRQLGINDLTSLFSFRDEGSS